MSQKLSLKYWLSFAALIFFGLTIKLYRLDLPKTYYFDEVYHAFTATRYLHGDPKVFDPWAKPPEGLAFEWTHPPLSKILMAEGMRIAGENSFGWRLGSVVFNTGAIALTGLLAIQLGFSPLVSLLTVFFMTLEGLTFVQGRIGMNDSYLIFFLLFTIMSYVQWRRNPRGWLPVLFTGVGLGLSLATKWTTLYLFIILALDLVITWVRTRQFPGNRLPIREAIAWTVIPVAIYIASYSFLFTSGGSWASFVELQRQMWYYHHLSTLKHPYSSEPWQWIFNLRPVWMYVDYSVPGKIGNIYNLGNSIVLITGLYSVYWTLFKRKIHLNWEVRFLALCYLMLWVPWIFSPRIMLFYHYLPAVPFLVIFLSHYVETLLSNEKSQLQGRAIIVASALWFVIFFPHMTAIVVNPTLASSVYELLPGWK
jgi:dolichyl-phosphate-mannose--protein O-mannosyl transferase